MNLEGWDRPPIAPAISNAGLAVPLEEAALLLARQEYPDLEPAPYLAQIDAWAGAARGELSGRLDAAEIVGIVSDVLFRDQQFCGNTTDYYDPRNSFLNDVIERRTGIPITLSILYMAVARRLGLRLHGTAFPGHFLIVHPRPEWPVVVDAFHRGRILSESECRALAEERGFEWDRCDLDPVPPRFVLRRVLNNLKTIYIDDGDWVRLLRTSAQILAVTPEEDTEHFLQALAWKELEKWDAAIRSLETYLVLSPDAENREQALQILAEMRLRS